jgi:hypothetical protein
MTTSQSKKSELINLHIAEYNMLTGRCTYYMNFQIVILTAGIATIGLIWNKNPDWLLSWWFLLTLLIYGNISAIMFKENYNILYYLEISLKASLHELEVPDSFWKYEENLEKYRNDQHLNAQSIWEWALVVIMILLFIGAILFHKDFSDHKLAENIAGLTLNATVLVLYCLEMIKAIGLRKKSAIKLP